jgi:hypothetical protein
MKISAINLEESEENYILTVCENGWIFKRITKYQAPKKGCCENFWSWRKLPNLELIPDLLSFQLDSFLRSAHQNFRKKV